VGIIVIDEAPVRKWATSNGKGNDLGELVHDKELNKAVLDSIIRSAVDHKFTSLEKPRKIYLTPDPFTSENGILTVT